MDIKESDWKVFRKLREVALERYCKRVLQEVRQLVDKESGSTHKSYLKLWGLLRNRDRRLGRAFNNPKRSQAIVQLTNMVAENLLTEDELEQFSEETRERIDLIQELRDRC